VRHFDELLDQLRNKLLEMSGLVESSIRESVESLTERFRVGWHWHRALSRRSQNGRVLWDRMRRLLNRWLPLPAVCHPYPLRRMGVIT
jgi:hypothetical protein